MPGGGREGSGSFLPSMLVGGFGEGSVLPALRLAMAMAQNGSMNLLPRLAQCGILIPVGDILRVALVGEFDMARNVL